ncbi:MAG: glycoside hydrolase family 38 C-terminal domain-containing protein [Candidatus Cloacimonadota bacterium]
MHDEKIHIERIKRLLERQKPEIHRLKEDMPAYLVSCSSPLSHPHHSGCEALLEIRKGEVWGKKWESAHFEVKITVPESFAGQRMGLWFDCDGEACVMRQGTPYQGLTPKVDWYHNAAKYYVPLSEDAIPGEEHRLLIEASANDLFGAGKEEYALRECALVSLNSQLRSDLLDLELLLNLATALPAGQVRRKKILWGLNEACNYWHSDRAKARQIMQELLSKPANASALTAYSVGHAHLDLAWLWPLRETKRKGGRTFANALRLMEQYPDYIFGASQAQLYRWIKDKYPGLYEEVKSAVKSGRWEIQGASWVEFDTNLPSGEAIIRQFYYGKKFFSEEFGFIPTTLWLPDCFGFNGNLPQLMKGCGVDYFMTQKLSWNETNTFPHHLFIWQGIDGTEVLAHQLPTNDYNFSNNPSAFLQTEERFAQAELSDAFLNLYGIGDGGGGPTLNHIEYGLRQQNLEGVSRFRFARSDEFFAWYKGQDASLLPKAYGELYLEFHRGTYTTQALMKQNNFISQRLLSLVEFLAAGLALPYPAQLHLIWEDTLLLQFHDIIPGSSITMVYEDAHRISAESYAKLLALAQQLVEPETAKAITVVNDSQWGRTQWIELDSGLSATDDLNILERIEGKSELIRVQLPPFSRLSLPLREAKTSQTAETPTMILENDFLRAEISSRGSILSLIIKPENREVLSAESNLLKLWEDEPNNWGAWDINHFYHDTIPQEAQDGKLIEELCINDPGKLQRLVQEIPVAHLIIRQTIELSANDRFLRIKHEIDWQAKHQMLRTHFYPNVKSDLATYEIAMGTIKRSTRPKNAWELAQFEVPAHRFADYSQSDCGCALLSKAKYGYRIVEDEMELNLLRSPADVDPTADQHKHCYEYGFYPHQGSYESSDVLQMAHCFAQPLQVLPGGKRQATLVESDLGIESAAVKLDTVKPAYERDGIVLRLYEYRGGSARAKISIPKGYKHAYRCRMTEEILEPLDFYDTLSLQFEAHQIITVLITREAQ